MELSFYLGFWGEVEVNNPHDIPIAFKWCPMNEVDCNVFFAMHSSGNLVWLKTVCKKHFQICSFLSHFLTNNLLLICYDLKFLLGGYTKLSMLSFVCCHWYVVLLIVGS